MKKRDVSFRIGPHNFRDGQDVVEVWFADQFVATLYGGRTRGGEPRVTLTTKHALAVHIEDDGALRQVVCTIGSATLNPTAQEKG